MFDHNSLSPFRSVPQLNEISAQQPVVLHRLVVFLGLSCLVAVWKLAQEYRGQREAQRTMHAGTAYTVCGALSVRIGSSQDTQSGR